MKDFFKKIVNSLLAIAFVLMSMSAALYFTSENHLQFMSASILDGVGAGDVYEVEFVTPKGSAYPINGVVTIQSVYVGYDSTGAGGSADTWGNISGADLENSFITFSSSNCPTGTVYSGNKIILPDTFNSSCILNIDIPGKSGIENTALTIEPVSCSNLQTSILRGYGSGFEDLSSATLPTASNTESFATGTSSVVGDLLVTADNAGTTANGYTLVIVTGGADTTGVVVSGETTSTITLTIETDGAGSPDPTWAQVAVAANAGGIFLATVSSPANGGDTVVTADANTITLAGGVDNIVSASGSVTINTGDAGDTWQTTINGKTGTVVPYNTSFNQTATDLAQDITNNIDGYFAEATGVTVNITAYGAGSNGVVSTAEVDFNNDAFATGTSSVVGDLLVTADNAGITANGTILTILTGGADTTGVVVSGETTSTITLTIETDGAGVADPTWTQVVTAANLGGTFLATVTSPVNGTDTVVTADAQVITLAGGVDNIVPTSTDVNMTGGLIKPFDFSLPISSINLNYPSTTTDGAQTFQIHLEFVSDVSVDPVNGISSHAEIMSNAGDGIYEIKVKDEGAGNESQTALNFAYVFNDLLGSNSPFIAYSDGLTDLAVQLEARELGAHTNDYICLVNGVQVTSCFTNGATGTVDVLTQPLTLDREVVQGDTAIVFAGGSAGEVEWISSHPSILEVVSLSEASQQDESSVDFVDDTVNVVESYSVSNGSYQVSDCQKEFDDTNTFLSETCNVTASVPVEYNISGIDFTVNVSIGDEVVPVVVQGSKLTGFVEGTSEYTSGGGVSFNMSGTVTGIVSGSVSGQYSGTVNGQVTTTVYTSASLGGQFPNELSPTHFTSVPLTMLPASEGALTDVPGTFVSTVKKEETDLSYVSLLFGKRPGTTVLTAIDQQGCIASFDLEVLAKKVILEMVGRSPGDVLDVSDTVQINAFTGASNMEKDEYENITAASGIEWFSSNEEVATIDGTGLLTALKPGVTNITARYDTGDAEIGTIESVPMQVTVNKISGLRVTFNKDTENGLPSTTVETAHESVIIAVHNPDSAGQTIIIEGQQVPITLPAGDYESDIAKVTAITSALNTSITELVNTATVPVPIVTVTTIDGFPGMLILQPLNQDSDTDGDLIVDIDENGIIDIDTTALEEDLSILPTYNGAIPLPASETYGLMVIAEYDNGATKLLAPTSFTWVNTPVNYLEQASLDSGFIRLGEISGTSTVVAEFENADGSIVQSNYLTIKVDSGPVIEFVRRIGSGSITKGSRIDLQTKITDVNTIADIASISTSLVYSSFDTYTQINSDASAIWFSAESFLEEVSVESQSTEVAEGEVVEPETTTIPLQFKTYNIPVEIPVDQNLFDGVYKLIITISDANNHTLNYVYPIRIGNIGEGDVDGNGTTNMVDVIIAFQIASGILPNPTALQLEAANVDGMGGVTLIDVILLFNTVSN